MPYTDLSATRCRFTCTGPDATRYLNGQLSQELRRVTPDLSLPSCITNAKGMLEAEVVVAAHPGGWLLDAPSSLRDFLATRLEKFLIADDCRIDDVTDAFAQFHGYGSPCPQPAPRSRRFGPDGWDIFVPTADASATLARLAATTTPATPAALTDLRVAHGIAAWDCDLDSRTLPPEAGLEVTHISYAKGCYIGQEVISRLRGVGGVTRRLCLVVAQSGSLSPHAEWFVHASADVTPATRPAGTIRHSIHSDGRQALAMLRRPHHAPGTTLYALPSDGSALLVTLEVRAHAPLPAPIPSYL